MDFPTNFSNETQAIPIEKLRKTAQQDIANLSQRGYEVRYGLTTELADQITKMSLEESIREYCPEDCKRRFTDRSATENWLSGGRAVFLLMKKDEPVVVGYGWTGQSADEHLMDGEVTFSLRIGEAVQGQGLATPFARLIIESSAILNNTKNIWLSTWQSNGGAVHIYHKIGFEDVDSEASTRPTADGKRVEDTRLYMSLPNELLPQA